METINNITSAASKLVFGEGETNKEPVSGVQGDTTRGEPFDAGNLDTTSQQHKIQHDTTTGSSSLGSDNVSSQSTRNPSGAFTETGHSSTGPTSTGENHSSHFDTTVNDTSLTDRSSTGPDNNPTDRTSAGQATTNLTSTDRTSASHHNSLSRENDTTSQFQDRSRQDAATTGQKDTTAGQNDTRDPDSANTDPDKKQDVDTKTPGPSTEGTDLKGPGPRPLETVALEHGGDAGNDKKETSKSDDPEKKGKTEEEKTAEEEAAKEVVPASGFAADGGDFDASNPGAGQEADRLLNEKHQHGGNEGVPAAKAPAVHQPKSHGHDEKIKEDKPSLGERIKAKLHKH